MTAAQKAAAYLEDAHRYGMRLGLSRMRALLQKLGQPQEGLRFVHVAGSNGKGSTCAMIESILRAAGYKTGLFTSPAVFDIREQIRVCGACIEEGAFGALTEKVRAAAETMDDPPTHYELLTALAMLYFAQQRCEIVVLEVALGGADDCTNVIDAPLAGVITSICLEHTRYLGNTLREIAAVKAGIIKRGSSVVCCENDAAVKEVIAQRCREQDVPLRIASRADLKALGGDLSAQRFSYRGETYALALLGEHQLSNAAAALGVIDVLREQGFDIPQDATARGFASVKWGARFEILRREPLFILDGGHNPQCADALAGALSTYFPHQKFTFLMGVLGDKALDEMIASVLPHAESFLCVTPPNPRALDACVLADAIRAHGARATAFESIDCAVAAAQKERSVVAFGSLYIMDAVKRAFLHV